MDAMPRPRPLYLCRETTRHKRVVWYVKRHGKRVRMSDPYGSEEFWEAYQAVINGKLPEKPAQAKGGSLRWLVDRYQESAAWASLRPSTQRMRGNILKRAVEKSGAAPFAAICKEDIDAGVMDRAATPNAANNFRKAMNQLFTWAKRNGHVKVNPCDGADRIKVESEGHHTWTVAEVEAYRKKHAVGTMPRLALDLLLFTGLRRSDVCLVGRQHLKDGVLSLRPTKPGPMLYLPVCEELAASIDATKTGDLAFLATSLGRPFKSAASFGNWFREQCDAAGLKHCSAHGLRKAGATLAAESGASAHELMAMFGWTKMATAEIYTREADRARLARAASDRIGAAMAPKSVTKSNGAQSGRTSAMER